MKCPICGSRSNKDYREFRSSKIDRSLLYGDIKILSCKVCGHRFNKLSRRDFRNLQKYYQEEYKQAIYTATKSSGNNFMGFGSITNTKHYVVNQDDIEKYGDDIIKLNSKKTNRTDLLSFLALDHALEHCWNLKDAVGNIKKILEIGGHLYVSVPDINQYAYSDNVYPFLIKEHVHHFSTRIITDLFCDNGFILIKYRDYKLPILNGKTEIPSVEFIFKHTGDSLSKINKNGTYYYGVSRELLHLHPGFKKKPDGFIDDTESKVGKTISGIKIYSSDIINNLSGYSTIIISSWFHKELLLKKIKDSGYTGKIQYL